MKCILIFIAILLSFISGHTQNQKIVTHQPYIKIHSNIPSTVTLGQSIKLKVRVSHNLLQEKTGQLTLALINHQTKKSVDGWFVNIFPFQYFTTIQNEQFETEFPFTVPYDYSGNFDIEIVAKVLEMKDSMHATIFTKKPK